MNIVAVDPVRIFPEHATILRSLGDVTIYDTEHKDSTEAFERLRDAEIIILYGAHIEGEVIEKLDKAKLIIVCAAGYDWVNIGAAQKKGILVTHCPGSNGEAVAEFTIGLIIEAARNFYDAAKMASQGIFSKDYHGVELKGKTIGIIGYGTIGKRVAEIAQRAFGMNVLTTNSKSSRADLVLLLTNSDFISINAPSNAHTRNMIGQKELALTKKGVVLVNTGRGAVIDEDALYDALRSGHIHGAGLDVMQTEPFIKDHKLFSLPNVIITPHIAYNTEETDFRLSAQIAEIAKSYIDGNTKYVIPEMKTMKT
ncbi:hypothetical protein HYS00_01900 [Candidatus Microgenomates bacterium]|nr:hypothetical protein [Candidatus Microgenomates bacterium]